MRACASTGPMYANVHAYGGVRTRAYESISPRGHVQPYTVAGVHELEDAHTRKRTAEYHRAFVRSVRMRAQVRMQAHLDERARVHGLAYVCVRGRLRAQRPTHA